jgi:hypothetical protein
VVSREAAERDYGVVLEQRETAWLVDEAATAGRRADMRTNSRSPSPTMADNPLSSKQ